MDPRVPRSATPQAGTDASRRRKSWLILGSLAAAGVVSVVGAVAIVGVLGGDDTDQLADGADTSAAGGQVEVNNTADTAQGAEQGTGQGPEQTTTGSAERPDPDPSAPAVSGTCAASPDEVEVAASPTSSRGVIAAFEREYFAGNATAIPGLLTGDSSMRDNDWDKVLDQVAEDSEYCLRMNPIAENSEGKVALELAITTDGERTVYRQIAETTSVPAAADNTTSDTTRWFIKEIRKAS
ncbi:hypothetical protein V6758_13940 [Corynebacterium kalidii]